MPDTILLQPSNLIKLVWSCDYLVEIFDRNYVIIEKKLIIDYIIITCMHI